MLASSPYNPIKTCITIILFLLNAYSVSLAQNNNELPLIHALNTKNYTSAQQLIQKKIDLNECNEEGLTPLIIAITQEQYELVLLLLKNGAKPNTIAIVNNIAQETPLMKAVNQNSLAMVKMLLEHKANPNVIETNGKSALMVAVSQHNIPIIKQLLNYGANPNIINCYNVSAYHFALLEKNEEIIKLLRQHGGKSESENMAVIRFNYALTSKDSDTLKELLASGIEQKTLDQALNSYAIYHDNQLICDLLLEFGANPFYQDENGHNAFIHAIYKLKAQLAKSLLEKHPQKLNNDLGLYYLHLVLSANNKNKTRGNNAQKNLSRQVLELLLLHGANPNLRNIGEYSPLMQAIFSQSNNCIEPLLNAGAAIEAIDQNDDTALLIAVAQANAQAVEILLNHSAYPHHKNSLGENAFTLAQKLDNQEIGKQIIELLNHANVPIKVPKAPQLDAPVPIEKLAGVIIGIGIIGYALLKTVFKSPDNTPADAPRSLRYKIYKDGKAYYFYF